MGRGPSWVNRAGLTEAGRQALPRARPLWAAMERRYFGQIGAEALPTLGALLDELLETREEQ